MAIEIIQENTLNASIFSGKTALFIDLDGTLADSLGLLYPVYLQFLANNGVEGSEAEFDQLNGPPIATIVQTLKEKYDFSAGIKELCEEYLGLVKTQYLDTVEVFEGVENFLDLAKSKGLKLFITTSNSRELVEAFLERKQLKHKFVSLFCGNDSSVNKTDPNYYPQMAALAGVRPNEMLVIEDSFPIIKAAQQNQVTSIGFCPKPRSPLPQVPIARNWGEISACLNALSN